MTHTSFQADNDLSEEVDVVVVGSGAGGATAAWRLAEGGLRVAIVEAGAWRDPDDYPASTYGSMRDLMDDWGAGLAIGRAFWPIVQARCVGGTTVINSAICVRTPDDVLTRWQVETGVDVSAMRAHFPAYQDALERALSSGPTDPAALGRSNRHAISAAAKLGLPADLTQRYAKGCAGSGQCLQGCKGGKKQSMNISFIPRVQALEGSVISCAPVTRIHFEGTRAVAVSGRFVHPQSKQRGAHFTVRAKRAVIVAASATKSPLLLMRSGVRNKVLGHGFRAHPGTGVFGIYDDPVDMNLGTTQGWASTAYRDTPGLKLETLAIPPELVASRITGGGHALMQRLSGYRHMAMWCHAVRAESVGRVSPGLLGPIIRYGLDQPDMVRFREGMYLLAKMHVAAGARSVMPGIFGFQHALQANEIDKLKHATLDPRHYVAILSHLFGGCVMGADPARSVVDQNGKVHGHEALYVADASIIPSNLGVNPQHTIMSLAWHVADHLQA